jgi:formylglycine-generating enzyme required for sulfatase activity
MSADPAGEQSSSTDTSGMRWLRDGIFTMGSEKFYPEERPLRQVRVDAFWIDEIPVTNGQFAEFVAATGYRSYAEIPPDPDDYPGMPAEMAQPGSLVFRRPSRPVDLNDFTQWWDFCFGADWRHPTGPDSSIEGLEDHPVVHITWQDADAYAKWAGKSLPTNWLPTVRCWPIIGRDCSHSRTRCSTGGSGRRRCEPMLPMAMVCST